MILKDGQVVEFTYNLATFIGMVTVGGIQTKDSLIDYNEVKILRVWDKDSSFYCLSRVKNEARPIYQRSKWEDVKVDTPITLVSVDGSKHYAHFAKWDGKHIHLWTNGRTSHTKHTTWITDESDWKEIIIVGE